MGRRKGHRVKVYTARQAKSEWLYERFNRTYREDVLDAYLFSNLHQLQITTDYWIDQYNTNHPHQSLGRMSPVGFRYSRRKVIDAYESVKAKMNGSKEPALTDSTSSIGCRYINI